MFFFYKRQKNEMNYSHMNNYSNSESTGIPPSVCFLTPHNKQRRTPMPAGRPDSCIVLSLGAIDDGWPWRDNHTSVVNSPGLEGTPNSFDIFVHNCLYAEESP